MKGGGLMQLAYDCTVACSIQEKNSIILHCICAVHRLNESIHVDQD